MKNVGDKIMVEVIIDEVRPEGYFTSFDGDKPSSVWVNKKFVEEDPPPVITLSDLPAKLVGFLESEGVLFDYLRMPGYKGYTGVLNFSVVQENRWIIFHDDHSGLYWAETPQGHDWWDDLNKKWRKYLKDPALVVSDIPKELAEFLADNVALQAYLCMPQYEGYCGKIDYDDVACTSWISYTNAEDQGFIWSQSPQGVHYWSDLNDEWLAVRHDVNTMPSKLRDFLFDVCAYDEYIAMRKYPGYKGHIDYENTSDISWISFHCIDAGFRWKDSPQGHDWWSDIDDKWQGLLRITRNDNMCVAELPNKLTHFLVNYGALNEYLAMPRHRNYKGEVNYDILDEDHWIDFTGTLVGFGWGSSPNGFKYWYAVNKAWLAYSSPSELPARLHSFLLKNNMLVDYVRSTMSVSIDYNIVPEYDWVLLLTVDLMEHNNFYNLHKMWVRELYEGV